jgi:hypothetical protein
MANQTNKSSQENTSGKGSGQFSGASTKRASESPVGSAPDAGRSAASTGSTPLAGSQNQTTTGAAGSNKDTLDQAKETAQTLVDQAKTTAGTAYEAATTKATSKLEEQKATVAGGLTSVAEGVRSMTSSLNQATDHNALADYTAQYADTAAKKLEQAARYFETTDVRAMARDIEGFARRNPAIFLGGAFALGMLAARFFKSTPRHLGGTNFQTGIDHQLPATGSTAGTTSGLGTTPGVM